MRKINFKIPNYDFDIEIHARKWLDGDGDDDDDDDNEIGQEIYFILFILRI
jgi:hypothetical protein